MNDDLKVITSPSKWPGVDKLVALLSREKEEDAPQLKLLLLEVYTAVIDNLTKFETSFRLTERVVPHSHHFLQRQ